MQTVNLKKYYYPLIREDVFVDVSDEVAECLLQLRREEERIQNQERLWDGIRELLSRLTKLQ